MELDDRLEWTATRLRNGWVIRPRGALGTCGWINGIGWTALFVKRKPAHIPEEN